MSVSPTSSGLGRFTALLLGLVVFFSVTMIGGTGYLKYRLDLAEIVLTSPNVAEPYPPPPDFDPAKIKANADARTKATMQMRYWAMLLTLATWFSLIVAAACAAGIYLVLKDRRSAPMRALAQSIQNMARGDMRTAIWGIERQDAVGELARAVDMARYHFSQMPDVSLMSEQGPVRLRFEGGARSLFEAMMRAFSTDAEKIREQSSSLAASVSGHKDAIEALSAKVETILGDIAAHGKDGDKLVMQAVREMAGGAENLKNAHAHAADQLTRLIPVIEDRARGLTEITQLAGKQLTHTLQSLASSEISLKSNAEKAKETLGKLSGTAARPRIGRAVSTTSRRTSKK
jgi:hypothetical protein